MAKALIFVPAAPRRHNWRIAGNAAAVLALVCVLASSLWLLVNPAADQPLLALLERTTGLGPASFLDAGDRRTYQEAVRDAARFQQEVAALNAKERAARIGTPVSDDEVRRAGSCSSRTCCAPRRAGANAGSSVCRRPRSRWRDFACLRGQRDGGAAPEQRARPNSSAAASWAQRKPVAYRRRLA
jgi:hypothetical protein